MNASQLLTSVQQHRLFEDYHHDDNDGIRNKNAKTTTAKSTTSDDDQNRVLQQRHQQAMKAYIQDKMIMAQKDASVANAGTTDEILDENEATYHRKRHGRNKQQQVYQVDFDPAVPQHSWVIIKSKTCLDSRQHSCRKSHRQRQHSPRTT